MDDAERRGVKFPRKGAIVRPQKNPIEWRVNVTQMKRPDGSALDGTDADELTAGEIDGRRQVHAVLRIPQARGAGLRRRLCGRHPRRKSAFAKPAASPAPTSSAARTCSTCASFADTIGVNGWPIEAQSKGDVEWRWPAIPQSRGFCHLPYRMLLPQKVRNLLVAGRCASMTHEGQSAARVSGACFVMGQAAGSAAHLSLAGNSALDEISIEALQGLLEKAAPISDATSIR